MTIREAQPSEREFLKQGFLELWPDIDFEDIENELEAVFTGTNGAPTFIALDSSTPIGFINLRTRDYAEMCETSPVLYIEGWWVEENYRGRGVGAALVHAAEEWGKINGFQEIASDAYADNTQSIQAHRSLGFDEHPPIVPLYKRL